MMMKEFNFRKLNCHLYSAGDCLGSENKPKKCAYDLACALLKKHKQQSKINSGRRPYANNYHYKK